MNTEGTRLKELRKALNIKQGDFAEKISTTQGHISDIENGRKNLSERTIKLICLEDWNGKMVSEQWLKYGQGEMFQPRPNMDEVGSFVEDLLEYDGKGNPLYDMIIEMMKKYQLLDESSKKIIRNYFGEIIKSVAEKKERES
ncbi:MAG: helix-turn-helix transcriptional regulator [Clostridiales bacterium]|nr:helix-turn-helix transcriptional regulator [Clostridiales bacterium]